MFCFFRFAQRVFVFTFNNLFLVFCRSLYCVPNFCIFLLYCEMVTMFSISVVKLQQIPQAGFFLHCNYMCGHFFSMSHSHLCIYF